MLSFATYKLIHLIGLFLLFFSAGIFFVQQREWGTDKSLKLPSWLGGGGMFLILLGGFGMLARLEMHGGWPGWIHAKLTLWVIATALVVAAMRQKLPGNVLGHALLVIAILAGVMALWKPF